VAESVERKQSISRDYNTVVYKYGCHVGSIAASMHRDSSQTRRDRHSDNTISWRSGALTLTTRGTSLYIGLQLSDRFHSYAARILFLVWPACAIRPVMQSLRPRSAPR